MLQEQPGANLRNSEKFHKATKALLIPFCLIRYSLYKVKILCSIDSETVLWVTFASHLLADSLYHQTLVSYNSLAWQMCLTTHKKSQHMSVTILISYSQMFGVLKKRLVIVPLVMATSWAEVFVRHISDFISSSELWELS